MDIRLETKRIGKGSFGEVYSGVTEDGEPVAVKSIPLDDDVPSILEASILTCFRHPHLLSAKLVYTDEENLHIIMEKGSSDLSRIVRLDKGGELPSLETFRRWAFSLASAVHTLHSHDIIHCDIKTSNILVFGDEVKLGDFGLACWGKKTRTYDICTITHRPLEVLFHKAWSKPVDIWSLGCAFHEMAFGSLLFPYQGEDLQSMPPSISGKKLRDRSINCLLDWASNYEGWSIPYRNGTTYQAYRLSRLWSTDKYSEVRDLLLGMLHPDNEKRLTIEGVLCHPFFSGLSLPSYYVHFSSPEKRYFSEWCSEVDCVASRIMERVSHLNLPHLEIACLRIACQIVRTRPPEGKVLETEKKICEELSFQFL